MPITGNAIDTNVLAKLSSRAGPQITSAIHQASLKTGVDFSYLMEKAAAESSFDADAQARTSSARGLYQFIESTWLQMVNRYGEKYGLDEEAAKISDAGKVSSKAARQEILALRDDPEIAAFMAGEFAAENKRTMINNGIPAKDIGSTELYLSHFLGAGAASEFIKGMKENPLHAAADIFPRAAKANPNVFYNSKTHAARSFGEIYAFFDKKFSNSPAPQVPPQSFVADNAAKHAPAHAVKRDSEMIDASALRIAGRGMNQISPDLLATINAAQDHDDSAAPFFAQRSAASTLPSSLNAARPLLNDPASLMMLLGHDNQAAIAHPKTSNDKDDRDDKKQATTLAQKLSQLFS